jgi:hypothetical protein
MALWYHYAGGLILGMGTQAYGNALKQVAILYRKYKCPTETNFYDYKGSLFKLILTWFQI